MAIVEIVEIPNPILDKSCEKITEFNDELKQLAQDLLETLDYQHDPPGAGLSAPQIGVLKRVCVARKFSTDPEKPDNELHKDVILVNPEITSKSTSLDVRWEACLSIPDTYGQVQRYKRITVKAQDLDGNVVKVKASGFFARIIQHERDHLDGVLFTSKVIGETKTEKELDARYAG